MLRDALGVVLAAVHRCGGLFPCWAEPVGGVVDAEGATLVCAGHLVC